MKRIIYDCDPGVDDALALVLALNSKRVGLQGITTVAGNVSVDQTTLNACRVLDYFGLDIPVAKGAGRPLKVPLVNSKNVHGNDGLGDSPLLGSTSARRLEPQSATDFILRSVESGIKTVVATGPLTNLALAFQKDSQTMSDLEELIIMGGALHTAGNVDSLSEFNFYADPHAADYVLQKTKVRKILVPLDATHRVILTSHDLGSLTDSPSGKLVKSITAKYLRTHLDLGFEGCPLHDPLAMGYCIDDSFLKAKSSYVRVETEGIYTRGVCVPEERPWVKREPNVLVASEVAAEIFLDYFKKTVSQ